MKMVNKLNDPNLPKGYFGGERPPSEAKQIIVVHPIKRIFLKEILLFLFCYFRLKTEEYSSLNDPDDDNVDGDDDANVNYESDANVNYESDALNEQDEDDKG